MKLAKAKKDNATPGPSRGGRSTPASRGGGGKSRGFRQIEMEDTTGRTLVIVESPAKARTINRYLGDEFVVRASMGHVRDLPGKEFGVDLSNDFKPSYVIVEDRARLVSGLKKMADQAAAVYLATDLDREGEAIAWHLAESLGIPSDKARRVVFNQITKDAIRKAFSQPHAIDMDKVMAQQARRVLDRIVGYQVSPLLWRKIRRGLSAGRVQTVAVRLIVEREREIRAFKADEYWEIVVELNPDSAAAASAAGEALAKLIASADPEKGLAKQELYAFCQQHRLLVADLVEFNGAKFRPNNQADAMSAVDALTKAAYHVAAIRTTQRQDKPSGPFTTASLQQAAVNQLHFTASQTMRLAQQLYEGVDLENEGRVGLITYMRTDSLNLAPEAISAAREFVTSKFGADFVPESVNRYSSAAGAQEAHEAVRPTDVTRTPDSLRGELPPPMWRLYDLIWRRFVACQMSPARWEILTVDVQADCPDNRTGLLRASARKLLFEGFLAVAGRRDSAEATLPDGVAEKAPLWPARVDPSQHFTEPPPRYTEASLVKALEAEGIGRPSTYAAIIDTIQNRGYVEQKDRRFFPLPIGEVVCDQLVAAFPKIFDVEFTRFMESELDRIENAHANWVTILREFYEPFSVCLAKAGDIITKPIEPSPYKCPKCAKDLVYRIGRTGRFIGCTGYPDCDYTANVDAEGKPVEPKEINAKCPECGKAMVLRASKRGPFLGCSSYPECTGTLPCDEAGNPLNVVEPESITATCPDCGQPMAVRFARGRAFLGCTAYPQCKATAQLPPGVTVRVPKSKAIETGILCEKCERPMVVRVSRRGPFLACTGFPRCRNARNLTEAERIAVEAGQRLEGPAKAPNAEAEETTSQPASTSESAPVAKGAKRKTKGKRASGSAPDASATASSPDATASDPSTEKTADAAVPANVPPGDLADLIKAGCPICHSPVTLRTSRFGPFLGCSNYPKCKTIVKIKGDAIKQARVALGLPEKAAARPKPAVTDIPCSKCGAMMVIRNGSSGQFLGCSTYPKCRHTSPLPVELTRPAEQR